MRLHSVAKVLINFCLLLLSYPSICWAQSQCDQVRAHVERLRQHVEQQRARGVPREQLNADIEIYNRWVSARDRVCAGGGGGAVSAGGSRQQTIGELQRLIGLLGAMNSQVPGAADFERELQAQLEAEERAQRAAEAESARRRANTANPFASNTAAGSSANPFSTSPPSHRLPTIPGTTFDTWLEEPKPVAANPFGHDDGCPSDTPGAWPGGRSLSTDCYKPRPTSPARDAAQGTAAPGAGQAGNPFGQRPEVITVEVGNAPIQPFGPAAGPGDRLSRNPSGSAPTSDRPGAGDGSSPGWPGSGARGGSNDGRAVQDATGCIKTDGHTATLTSANGTSGYFNARNTCNFNVIAVGCYRRLSGGQTCITMGGPPGWSSRITFAYAASSSQISLTWRSCVNDLGLACVESLRAYSRQMDDGRRP